MTEVEYIEEQFQAVRDTFDEYGEDLLSRGECLSLQCVHAENLAAAIARADESEIELAPRMRSAVGGHIRLFARGPNLARYSRALNNEWKTNPDIEVGPDSLHAKGPDAVGAMSPEEALEWFG